MRTLTRRAIACEPLENRLLFFTYQVTGTNGSDAISLTISGNSIISVVNGVSDSASDIWNNKIEINALGGSDTISIIKNGANDLTINGGSGGDTINFSPGARNLDAFNPYAPITVNGGDNTDTVVLFDDNQTEGMAYCLSDGNRISRFNDYTGVSMAANAESVVVRAGPALGDPLANYNLFQAADPPAFALSLIGGAGTDIFDFYASAGDFGSFKPSATTANSGSVGFSGSSIDFQSFEAIVPNDFSTFTFTTPNANDDVRIVIGKTVQGSSGGVSFSPLIINTAGTLTLDLGLHDGTTGNDTLELTGTQTEISLIQINSGIGTDTLTNTGTFTIDSIGSNLRVINDGGTLTFDSPQFLKRLEVNNGGLVRFVNGTSTVLTAKELAVTSGSGTLELAQGQSGNVPVGQPTQTFSIVAGHTLIKKGAGSFSVFGLQNHGSGAHLNVLGGTFNMHSDAGSATARPLNLLADGGTINLGATQHVNSVVAEVGSITMLASGNRVLVTNSASIGIEAGAIDLRDNDMVVDYSTTAEAQAVRDMLFYGRSNGSWNGIGIASSTAAANPGHLTTLGLMEATHFKLVYGQSATFDGQALDDTALLIKYTYYGDADFNGRVTSEDYQYMSLFNNGEWIDGDFDDDGTVDNDDLALIDAAFIGQGPAL